MSAIPRQVLVGDLNVAPGENDVWSHKQLVKVVSHTPIEVEKLDAMRQAGAWTDVLRAHVAADSKAFTWWSYRARDWRASNRGRRLDHIWVTPAIGERAAAIRIIDATRGWARTSDHVPVVARIEVENGASP
jgi:exodeoxyribonuclease-3